ncbi:hypothetical protein GE21DRAFT_1335905 [Neurospora crassa]|nr:hypothetical protein GE21DRAFT_1335905 [Neurospora crassa]
MPMQVSDTIVRSSRAVVRSLMYAQQQQEQQQPDLQSCNQLRSGEKKQKKKKTRAS